jgi:multidrug efflux pump
VQQYPEARQLVGHHHDGLHGASAETVRGFLTTPIERAVSAIGGIDHIESDEPRRGQQGDGAPRSSATTRTRGAAEVTARLQQVRSELPAEAEPPRSTCSAPTGPTRRST